jgi:hypothetical protein
MVVLGGVSYNWIASYHSSSLPNISPARWEASLQIRDTNCRIIYSQDRPPDVKENNDV